ncbi:unnamed protein product, partial [Prunus brigantina]
SQNVPTAQQEQNGPGQATVVGHDHVLVEDVTEVIGGPVLRSNLATGTTRWGSHFSYIRSLIDLFGATKTLPDQIGHNGPTSKFRGEDESIYIAMMSFEFAFALLLLDKTMGFTDFLCQALQSKSQDIVSALNLVSST